MFVDDVRIGRVPTVATAAGVARVAGVAAAVGSGSRVTGRPVAPAAVGSRVGCGVCGPAAGVGAGVPGVGSGAGVEASDLLGKGEAPGLLAEGQALGVRAEEQGPRSASAGRAAGESQTRGVADLSEPLTVAVEAPGLLGKGEAPAALGEGEAPGLLAEVRGSGMLVELRPLAAIKPYEKNPRINDAAVDAVAESIRRFGFRQPIVVDGDGVIVCGHTRWKAAQKLGLTEVPVHVARDLTPEQIRAYRIADNKTAELAEWNLDLLPIELAELQGAGIDWSLLGFDADELAKLLGGELKEGLTDPDEVPAPPDEAITQPGDLWVLGNHRLLCGDAGNPGDVDRLLDGQPVHLVNTDPPYNVRVEPRSNNAIAAGLSSFVSYGNTDPGRDVHRNPGSAIPTHSKLRPKDRPLANDFVSDEEFDRLLRAWFGNIARVLLPGRGFYIWGGYSNIGNYPPVLKACELYFSQTIIWDKQHPVLTRKDFMGAHEWAFYGWREGAAHVYLGPNNATDLWHVKKVNPQSMIHLTEKPVELAVRAMQYSSRAGENVLDLFGGSGSTLIAAEQTGRRAFLMELDPLYCDVIVQRWEKFTGRKAERCQLGEVAPTVVESSGSLP